MPPSMVSPSPPYCPPTEGGLNGYIKIMCIKTKKTIFFIFLSGALTGCDEKEYKRSACADDIDLISVENIEVMQKEVSNKQYNCCVREGGCALILDNSPVLVNGESEISYLNTINKSDEYSVEAVEWEEAHQFCTWIGMRLPMQQEWEKIVIMGGGGLYPWGYSSVSCNQEIACATEDKPTPCSFEIDINSYGVCDLGSGLAEWTSTSTFEGLDGDNMLLYNSKGGSYADQELVSFFTRTTSGLHKNLRRKGQGFRCVK